MIRTVMSKNRSQTNSLFGGLARGVLALVAVACLAACGGDDMVEPGDTCSVGQVLGPGQKCSVGGDSFEVVDDGLGLACLIEPDGISRMCSTHEVVKGSFSASNIEDTSDWRIDSMP